MGGERICADRHEIHREVGDGCSCSNVNVSSKTLLNVIRDYSRMSKDQVLNHSRASTPCLKLHVGDTDWGLKPATLSYMCIL